MLKPLHQVGEWVRDRYQIHKLLGQGATGDTYQAEDLQQHHWVALKVISLQRLGDWDSLERFEREAKALEIIDHPGVPDYIEHFQQDTPDDKRFYLVQEFASGKSLAEWVEEGWRATEAEVQQIAVELLSILNYLHQLDPPMLHRDVKPQNIIRQSDGRLYLVDFGAVQSICQDSLRQRGTFVGTMGYMPPEQLRGQVQFASDLYALGATVVFLLTHRNPDELPMERMKIRFQGRVAISKPFADWLEKMLEPSLKKRFTSAKVAIAALERSQESRPKRRSLEQHTSRISSNLASLSQQPGSNTLLKAKKIPTLLKKYENGELFYLSQSSHQLKIESPAFWKMIAKGENSGCMTAAIFFIIFVVTIVAIILIKVRFTLESIMITLFLSFSLSSFIVYFIYGMYLTIVRLVATDTIAIEGGRLYHFRYIFGKKIVYIDISIKEIEALRSYGKNSPNNTRTALFIACSRGKSKFLRTDRLSDRFSDWVLQEIHDFLEVNRGLNVAFNTFPNPEDKTLNFHQARVKLQKNDRKLRLTIQSKNPGKNISFAKHFECDSSRFSLQLKLVGIEGYDKTQEKLIESSIFNLAGVDFEPMRNYNTKGKKSDPSLLYIKICDGERYTLAEGLDIDEMEWIVIAVKSFLQEFKWFPSRDEMN